MDSFYEQLVTTYKTGVYKFTGILPYVFIPIGIIFFLMGAVSMVLAVIGIIFIAGGAAAYFLKKYLYVEFEYVFTNGEIDIDKIINVNSRKRVKSFDIKDAELVALEDSYEYKDFSNKPSAIINAFPKTCKDKVFVAVVTRGIEKFQLRFVPNSDFINYCFMRNPRAVKKDII